MYGRYTKDLGEYAKEEARKVKALERKRKKEDRQRNKELHKYRGKCASKLIAASSFVWRHTFARLGEDWVFLALLGILMAFISFLMDRGISMCNQGTIQSSCFAMPSRLRTTKIQLDFFLPM
jgi:chloride channel 2